MRIKLNIPENSIKDEVAYTSDVRSEGKQFPVLTVGRDSYIEEAWVENVIDEALIYNIQVGRYTSIAGDVRFIVDMNHDYKRPCQGRITGVPYLRPHLTKRKGQIVIMNDCWIGQGATIISGVTIGNGAVVSAEAVVTKDVPSYAIVAGNPAKIIGYRFDEKQREALNIIRWWNYDTSKIQQCGEELYGDMDCFLKNHIEEAVQDAKRIPTIDINFIEKNNQGEEKVLLYIPDFEQDYPTYPRVIDAFVNAYSDTNYELLLYVKEDDLLDEKLSILDRIFSKYEDKNCYVNLYIGQLEDERSLFAQIDCYITNRSLDNVRHMDMADLFGVPTISGVDLPIFEERVVSHMVKEKQALDEVKGMVVSLTKAVKSHNESIAKLQESTQVIAPTIRQLSVNQVAMNQSIDNLKYEILAAEKNVQYPIVESGAKAIELILKEHKSMSRFGDGEFAVIAGVDRQKFQRADAKLGERLKEVLQSKDSDVLVCIADTYGDLSKYNNDCRYNIRAYMTDEVRKQHYELLDMNRIYYDTYVTRPYASYLDNVTDAPKQRFKQLKEIWNQRDVLMIEGEKTRLGVGNDLFDNCRSIVRILGPAEHAFDRYDEILVEAKKQSKDKLVLIAMGATATVLAYDLAKAGYQALDIGHVDMEYEWMLAGKGTKVSVPHKYNNEVAGGDVVEDIQDSTYESQIVVRCY